MAARLAPTQRMGAAFPAAISAGLLKPLSSLCSANSLSSASSRTEFTEERRFSPPLALSNAGLVAPRRTFYGDRDGGGPNRIVYEQNGALQQQQQQDRGSFPRPPVILWEKDFANAVQLIGRVGRNVEIKYLNSGKIVATTSLAVHKESQTIEDSSWFTLEIWNDLAEIAAHHVKKGELIFVAGKIVIDKRVYDGLRSTTAKVVVRDLFFVEPSSDRRQPLGPQDDELTVRGFSNQSQVKEARMDLSQRNWNQRQTLSEPSQGFQGARGHGTNVIQLETQTPQSRAGATKWREAPFIAKQNRNPSENLVSEVVETAHRNDSTDMGSAGDTAQAIAVLQNRIQRGLFTDSNTYIKVLQMCLKHKDLFAAKQIHDCSIQSGMDKNIYVAGTLLNVYIKCGALVDARRVFDEMKQNSVVGWTSMISGYAKSNQAESALELFNQMRQAGVEPNEITYLAILNACTSILALKQGKEIHQCIRRAGFESDVRVGTALLKMYARCGCIAQARQVFQKLTNRDVVTWTVMIGALAQHGCGDEAYRLFLQMRQEGFEPDAFTYVNILNANASAEALKWVKEVHGHAIVAGLESNLRVANALVHMYSASGSIDDARQLFHRMEKLDIVTWNVMIGALAQHGCGHEAYRLFLQMRREGFEPNAFTYASLLKVPASAGALEWVTEVHGLVSKAGLESDLRVGSALIHIYAEGGNLDKARQVFDRMEKRDVVTWNIMIGGLAQHGHGQEAYQLFVQMRQQGCKPDAVTYLSILNAAASAGALEWVKEVHAHAIKAGLESDLRVGNALVHMYAESGSIEDARQVFDRMEKRDVVSWNGMIRGLAHHGCGQDALELFKKMIVDLVKPDETTFVAVLSACCHGGLVDDGRRLFSAFPRDYGIQPNIFHYTCMVDLLGRAGHLDEAKRVLSDMPIEPNLVIWTALLGACRTHGNVELGELAANELFKMEPSNASTYVLLSNIYAAAGKWEKVSLVRTMMQQRGVRKDPGRSWIEVDKKIHEFVSQDTSHPEAKAIYAELNTLTEKLKAEGYIPDTRLVLHDISEEDKELALCSHSEKLAIAYGLMHIPRGQPIRIEKNLRVCPDCHTVTKLISKVTGREIIARDANRFHHFKDGVCSCGDYW